MSEGRLGPIGTHLYCIARPGNHPHSKTREEVQKHQLYNSHSQFYIKKGGKDIQSSLCSIGGKIYAELQPNL